MLLAFHLVLVRGRMTFVWIQQRQLRFHPPSPSKYPSCRSHSYLKKKFKTWELYQQLVDAK